MSFVSKKNTRILSLILFAVVLPLVILGGIIFINQNNAYKNAQLLVASETFKSYEMPKFKLYLNEEKDKISFLQAFAQVEPGIESKLIDSEGNETELSTTTTQVKDGEYDITVNPVLEYRPGDYTIETRIYSALGERTITQEFSWGVIAFNTNKATYYPKEEVKVSIGVLDERGLMVCGAKVELLITNKELGFEKVLTSEKGDIVVHEVCKSFEFTLDPDFSTSFILPDQEGEYQMKLTAVTHNGTHTIENSINVVNSIPFEIERISATRTYPLNDYPMYIIIKANQDFAGRITETVPTSFDVIESHQDGIEGDYAAFTKKQEIDKTITWDVDMKKGETYTFDYIFDPPNISPEFFLLGNLAFHSTTNSKQQIAVYSENRYWQIANDATHILTTGTTWTVPYDWDDANNSFHVIGGGGGGGAAGDNATNEAGGGGGGAGGTHTIATNINLVENDNAYYRIGSGSGGGYLAGTNGGTGGSTYLCSENSDCTALTGTSVDVGANGGDYGRTGTGTTGGAGGTAVTTNSVGTATAGGNGGIGADGVGGGTKAGGSGGGGGGAAGPNGTGAAGGSPASGANGGAGGRGDSTSGGTGGSGGTFGATCTAGGAGNAGTEWTVAGSGGGGGGGGGGSNGNNACNGGAGGNYGAGGGGGGGRGRSGASTGTGGSGKQGVIYISYAPLTLPVINVSGNVYDAGTSNTLTECDGSGVTYELRLRHAGSTYSASCSSSDGSFTFSTVSTATGSGMIIWIDDAEAPETDGAFVGRYDGTGDSTGNTFYDDTITLTSDDSNAVTNNLMNTYDADTGDVDIPYVVTLSPSLIASVTASNGAELLVKEKSGVAGSGNYDPGGEVTLGGGSLHLDDNSTASLDTESNSISGDIVIDTDATLTISANTRVVGGDIIVTGTLASSGTPTVTMVGNGTISGAGTKTIYNLVVGEKIKAYVANYNSVDASVINTSTNTVISSPYMGRSQYVAIVPDGTKAYFSNLADGKVSVINTSTDTVSSTISVGTGPNAIAITPVGSKAYVVNYGSGNVSVINTSTDTFSTTISGMGSPYDLAITPDGTKVYVVTFASSNNVIVINTSTDTVASTISAGTSCTDIIITPDGSKAYVLNVNSHDVSVINTSTDTVSTTISGMASPYDLAITPDGTKVYVVNNSGDSVSVINTSTDTVSSTISVGTDPSRIIITPDGSKAYVTNSGSANVSVINTSTDTVSTTISAAAGAMDITPDGSKVYVANSSNIVSVINTSTDTVSSTISVGTSPYHIAIATVSATATITLSGDLSVSNDLFIEEESTLNGTANLTVGSSAVSNAGDISVDGILSMTGGTVTLGSSTGGTATVGGGGSITFYNMTFGPTVASAPTFTLGSAASQTINVSNDLTIGNGANPVTVTANSNNPTINVDRDFTVSANGTFTAPPTSNFTVARNFTNNGTFTSNGGEVILDTTTNSIIDGIGTPAVAFQDFTSTTQNKAIQFTQSKTFQIDGTFTLTGASGGNYVDLGSTTSTQWLIDLNGSASVTYADISNSGCAVGTGTITLNTTNSNSGNNGTCWDFVPQVNKPTIRGGATIRGGTTLGEPNPGP